MYDNMRYASVTTPTPTQEWLQHTDSERLQLVKNILASKMPASVDILMPISAQADGQVMCKFLMPIGPETRGTLLLDVEEMLKDSIDQGLYVLLEAMGDRNSLRNLRGIEVKS